jgi:hypothetical protein
MADKGAAAGDVAFRYDGVTFMGKPESGFFNPCRPPASAGVRV